MDINKKDRVTLKSYFRKNLVPTESNFAELIDGMLNQKDDGIAKLPGDPLSIAAAGEAAGPQKLINFFGNLGDANPAWMLQLNPRSDQNDPATAKSGFSVSDGQGVSRLFIDKSTGNIGVGTIKPVGKLDIVDVVRFGLDEGKSGIRSISFARDPGDKDKNIPPDEENAGKITYKGGFGSSSLHIVGAGPSYLNRNIKLWDNVEVVGALTVRGNKVFPKIKIFRDQVVQNGGIDSPGKIEINYPGEFSEVYECFVMLQGHTLANGTWEGGGHWKNADAIPQVIFVKIIDFKKDRALVAGYCSESKRENEGDNAVMFTLVVIGR